METIRCLTLDGVHVRAHRTDDGPEANRHQFPVFVCVGDSFNNHVDLEEWANQHLNCVCGPTLTLTPDIGGSQDEIDTYMWAVVRHDHRHLRPLKEE